jgi:hypothetical protein
MRIANRPKSKLEGSTATVACRSIRWVTLQRDNKCLLPGMRPTYMDLAQKGTTACVALIDSHQRLVKDLALYLSTGEVYE